MIIDRFTVILGIIYFVAVVVQAILTATILPHYPFTAAVTAEGGIFGLHYYQTSKVGIVRLRMGQKKDLGA